MHVLNPSTGETIWLRKYDPVEHDLASLPYDDPKIAGMYCFTVAALSQTTSLMEPVVRALADLLPEIPSLRLQGPPTAASGG